MEHSQPWKSACVLFRWICDSISVIPLDEQEWCLAYYHVSDDIKTRKKGKNVTHRPSHFWSSEERFDMSQVISGAFAQHLASFLRATAHNMTRYYHTAHIMVFTVHCCKFSNAHWLHPGVWEVLIGQPQPLPLVLREILILLRLVYFLSRFKWEYMVRALALGWVCTQCTGLMTHLWGN